MLQKEGIIILASQLSRVSFVGGMVRSVWERVFRECRLQYVKRRFLTLPSVSFLVSFHVSYV